MTPDLPLLPLACPVCGLPLARVDTSLRCEQAHTFDVAREGYVNLLPATRALSATVGDTPEMLAARRAFLAGGHYAPLSAELAAIAAAEAFEPAMPNLLDAGCGDGYYLAALQAALAERGHPASCFGIDVAKAAVRLAAKQHRGALFAVADTTKRLPFLDGSIALLLNMFAPRNAHEFGRVITPGGLLLIVLPAPDHLRSLRRALPLLDIQAQKSAHVAQQFADGFTLRFERPLSIDLTLDKADLRRLVMMSPSSRHFSDRDWQVLDAAGSLQTRAAFTIMQFRRT